MGTLSLNQEYKDWLGNLKERIRQSQIKAAFQVNEELLRLYWEMGCEITERQKNANWGSGFLRQLSLDLRSELPDMKGFSLRNLECIRLFYQFYSSLPIISQQLVAKLFSLTNQKTSKGRTPQSVVRIETKDRISKGQQAVAQLQFLTSLQPAIH